MLRLAKFKMNRGFTLVELLIVVAIISVLAAVALPAYNNYALKSRFTEVMSATNPIKTYVSSCASDGSCVQNNKIFFDLSTPSAQISAAVPDQVNVPSNEQQLYSILYTTYQNGQAQGYTMANSFASAWSDLQQSFSDGTVSVATDPDNSANTCILYTSYNMSMRQYTTNCLSYSTTTQTMASQNGMAQNVTIPTSMAPSAVDSYSSINGSQPAVVQAAHTGTSSVPCQNTSDAACYPSTKYVATAYANSSGVITATAQSTYNLGSNTFILIPSYSSGRVDWVQSGSCKTRQGGALC